MRVKLLFFFGMVLLLFQIFVFQPIAIWEGNKFNLEAPLPHAVSIIGIVCLAILVLSAILAFLTPEKLKTRLLPILSILVTLIFIQQNFLTWNYGILDGQKLNFDKNKFLGLLDAVIWILGFILIIFCRKIISKNAGNILFTLAAISTISVGAKALTYGEVFTTYSIDETDKYNFSTKKNIIVFLFDAYQMDVFLDIADSNPQLLNPFEGFTLYENKSAVFAKTYPTIPLMLTGKRYNKDEPILEFFKTAYKDSYLREMKTAGWDVGLYPNIDSYPSLVNAVDINPKTISNIFNGISEKAKLNTYLQVLDLSLFRTVPHQLKSFIYNDGNFLVKSKVNSTIFNEGDQDLDQPFIFKSKQKHGALAFRDLLKAHGNLSSEDPAFRFYHFAIPHAPNTLDGNLNSVKHIENFEAYRDYSLAAFKLMGSYLETLKRIGAYDNSAILIVSDHGMGIRNKRQYNSQTQSYDTIDKFAYHRSAAKAIMLMKNPGEKGKLKTSRRPVSGIDIAPTLAAAANLSETNFEGMNVRDIQEDEDRKRIFNYYAFSTWDSKYLNSFEQFEIDGDVRNEDAWTLERTLKIETKFKNKDKYEIGELLSYGKDVKSDSDFFNAFINDKKYVYKSSHLTAENGRIDIDLPLSKPLTNEDFLLMQFKVYSGASKIRQVLVNDEIFEPLVRPRKRSLNQGFYISPDVHKNRNKLNISFKPKDPTNIDPLRLSSLKFSRITLENISANEDLSYDIKRFYPVDTTVQKSKSRISITKDIVLTFGTSDNLCLENNLNVKLKIGDVKFLKVYLNGTLLKSIAKLGNESQDVVTFECTATLVDQPNNLKLINTSAQSKISEPITIQDLRFEEL